MAKAPEVEERKESTHNLPICSLLVEQKSEAETMHIDAGTFGKGLERMNSSHILETIN
jgi:hypothetical protein